MLSAERPELLVKQYIVFVNGGWTQIPVLCVLEEKPHSVLNRDCLDRFEVPLPLPGSHTINSRVPVGEVQGSLDALAGQTTGNMDWAFAAAPCTRPVWTSLEMATEQRQHKNTNGTYWERAILLLSLSALLLMQ